MFELSHLPQRSKIGSILPRKSDFTTIYYNIIGKYPTKIMQKIYRPYVRIHIMHRFCYKNAFQPMLLYP